MDESWRCTMGSVLPRQRSSDGKHAGVGVGGGGGGGGHQSLAPDDFRDVFGGPPRTVLLSSFYGEAVDYCGHPGTAPMHGHGGQYAYPYGGAAENFGRRPYVDGRGKLAPTSAAVPTEEGFFDDIFGARHMRSRSRTSKSTKSSSVVSSDEFGLSFGRQAASGGRGGDAALSSFASKLRPIAIPSRRYDSSPPSTVWTRGDYQSSFTCSTAAYPACRYYYGDGDSNAPRRTNHSGGSAASSSNAGARHHRATSGFCCFTSNPETRSHEASFRRARRGRARSPAADADLDTATDHYARGFEDYGYCYDSPPSAASSTMFGNPLPRTPRRLEEAVMMEVRERAPLLMDDDGDIDGVGAAAVDEAIAWAKERFWSQPQ